VRLISWKCKAPYANVKVQVQPSFLAVMWSTMQVVAVALCGLGQKRRCLVVGRLGVALDKSWVALYSVSVGTYA